MLCFSNLKLLFKTFVPLMMHSLDLFHKVCWLKGTIGLCPEIHCDSKSHMKAKLTHCLSGKVEQLNINA